VELCRVKGCERSADFEVFLYDVYLYHGEVFFAQDFTCPFLCSRHMILNEEGFKGRREPRGMSVYQYTNQECAQGFSIYKPLE
jgi:hypothetical protein